MTRLFPAAASCLALFGLGLAAQAWATETEHYAFSILPAPGEVVIDGRFDDWDLSGSLFICSDVESYRDQYASWQSAMYDAKYLYVLTRWLDDTPMNNPGAPGSDMGFQGDCLQLRTVVRSGGDADGDADDKANGQRTSHLDCWIGRGGRDAIEVQYGKRFDEGGSKDVKGLGGKQAFLKNADGKGYVQEIAIPWAVLSSDGKAPAPGSSLVMTFEPNFGTATKLRITTKDLFRAGRTPDRVFTFGSPAIWGRATLARQGHIAPPPVQLTDHRTFKVTVDQQRTLVDWTGLYREDRLEGFAAITVPQAEDGFVSLVIRNGEGQVVRNLLSNKFLAKGAHQVLWDGLTTPSDRKPGEPVAPGSYSWEAISNKGIGLALVGWADNSGKAPFDSPGGNWGGDQGDPISVDADGGHVYLGWAAAEAGQAVVCTDLAGKVQWRHKRGGFGGAALLATNQGVVYVYDQGQGNILYRLDAAKGDYLDWAGGTVATLELGRILAGDQPAGGKHEAAASGMAAVGDRLLVSHGSWNPAWKRKQPSGNRIHVLDAASGKLLASAEVADPNDLKLGADGKVYAVLGDSQVATIDPATGAATIVLSGLSGIRAVGADKDGNMLVAVGDPANQIRVYSKEGKLLRAIGREGGRRLVGPWQQDGMRFVQGIKVDAKGHVWAMEYDRCPRRISVWDVQTGAFVQEFFGPTEYGASGGAICPTDALRMAGQNCEWKLSPETGRSECVAVIGRELRWQNARFGTGKDGRTYLAVGGGWAPHYPVCIFERLATGEWKLRTRISTTEEAENKRPRHVTVWADRNDDQQEQGDEVASYDVDLGGTWIDGWYLYFNQAMTFSGTSRRVDVTGWTACGAPEYDFGKALAVRGPKDIESRGGMGAQRGLVSEDGVRMLFNGHYGQEHSTFDCYDITSGKLIFSYPNNYVGVHGGHHAPPAKDGLIRAAYDIIGTFPLPGPLKDIFVIATDKGEWHLLSSTGHYVGRLFEGDAIRIRWPDEAIPGANMNVVPPGMGAEDFGGSLTRLVDGSVHVQHGKTAFINSRITGLDTIRVAGTGSVQVAADDVAKARAFQQKLLAGPAAGPQVATVARRTVRFTGDAQADFAATALAYGPAGAQVQSWLAHDDTHLYVAWLVQDKTPWINGASGFDNLYACGDTVDLQLATVSGADPQRSEAGAGDLRLSLGRFKGHDTAVLYRKVSSEKAPRTFFSGTRKDGYTMELVKVLPEVQVSEKIEAGARYLIEAAIPLASLGIASGAAQELAGDVGVTFSDPAGSDTNLRVYWSNQATGLVADEVEELRMQPNLWGKLRFE